MCTVPTIAAQAPRFKWTSIPPSGPTDHGGQLARHLPSVPDGQFPHMRHAQIARRAGLPRDVYSDFHK
jgi:hypothetical protein